MERGGNFLQDEVQVWMFVCGRELTCLLFGGGKLSNSRGVAERGASSSELKYSTSSRFIAAHNLLLLKDGTSVLITERAGRG